MPVLEVEKESALAGETSAPPEIALLQLLFGKHVAFCISAVARLGVADHMSDSPASVDELAAKVGAHAPSLYRVMRMLAGFRVFEELPVGRFTLTPIGQVLRSDAPVSVRPFAIMHGDLWSTRAFEKLPHSIKTGQDGITAAFGKNVFEIFRDDPDQAATFHEAMTQFSRMAAQAVTETYDFEGIQCLPDVGGGHGLLLASILKRNPNMRGVLFDLPEVAGAADAAGHLDDCKERISIESGSFFERVPDGCDAYIMKHILHDWSDDRCKRILTLIRERIPSHGRVLVCDTVVTEGTEPSFPKLLDIEMLAHCVGGKERTEAEFSELFESAGFRLERVVKTAGPVCIVEAKPR